MLVELGNPAPKHAPAGLADGVTPCECCGRVDIRHEQIPGPAVTYVAIPDTYSLEPGADISDIALHLFRNPETTNLPGHEALLPFVHPQGLWPHHRWGEQLPDFVHAYGAEHEEEKAAELVRLLSEFYDIPAGRPDVLEDVYYTRNGMPGVGPLPDAQMTKTNVGNDIQTLQMGLGGAVFGQTGTATATSATSLTGGTEAPGGSHAANDCAGFILVAWGNGAWGLITANTSGTTPVYTVDRWYTPGSPGGAAATTPGATTGYSVLAASPPAYFMGLSTSTAAVNATDTTLASEITTAGGGLLRKICPLAHTIGAASYTLTPVFTANGSDSFPAVVGKIGVSQSIKPTVNNLFQTLLPSTATLNALGDQLTVTESVSL